MNPPSEQPGQYADYALGPGNESQEPGLVDALHFLYSRRIRLTSYFVVLFGIGTAIFLYSYLSTPKSVEAVVALLFKGIEKSEYPSGRNFSVEDFRSPEVLSKALEDAAIPAQSLGAKELAALTYVTPMVPPDIQNRWKKQEQTGTKKEDYLPNEYKIAIEASKLTDKQRIRLLDAMINRYRERVKYEQESALGFIYSTEYSYDKLATAYELWDIPGLFRGTFESMRVKLENLVIESLQFQDPSYQISFKEIAMDLDTWERTRLQVLEALTYEGGLVRNRAAVAQRIQFRIQDFDIRITQQKREAEEAIRLLQVIEAPRGLISGQPSSRDGTPMIDATAIDKLLKTDYVAPVVKRISKLQADIQMLEAEKDRLTRQFSWLSKSSETNSTIPAKDLTNALSSDLHTIIEKYNRLLERYLVATTTSLIFLKQPPILVQGGYSPFYYFAGLACLSVLFSLALIALEHLFKRARIGTETHETIQERAVHG